MIFPNRINSYEQSVLCHIPEVLTLLAAADKKPEKLFAEVQKDDLDIITFIDILDCLFLLGKVVFIPEASVLHYVD